MGVPMTQADVFRKSSYSVSQGACVEVGYKLPGSVVIRDSTDIDGTAIPVSPLGWRQFVGQVKLGGRDER